MATDRVEEEPSEDHGTGTDDAGGRATVPVTVTCARYCGAEFLTEEGGDDDGD